VDKLAENHQRHFTPPMFNKSTSQCSTISRYCVNSGRDLTIQTLALTFRAHFRHEFHRQLEAMLETSYRPFHAKSAQNASKSRLTSLSTYMTHSFIFQCFEKKCMQQFRILKVPVYYVYQCVSCLVALDNFH